MPIDSEYVIFIVDTSGSMQSQNWRYAEQKLGEVLNIYPKLKGIQVMDDEGGYMFTEYRGKWIPDSPARRKAILDRFRGWQAFSNSSPSEGIIAAVRTFWTRDHSISLYVFGDEFTGSVDPGSGRHGGPHQPRCRQPASGWCASTRSDSRFRASIRSTRACATRHSCAYSARATAACSSACPRARPQPCDGATDEPRTICARHSPPVPRPARGLHRDQASRRKAQLPPPLIEQLPVRVGIHYSKEFSEYVHKETRGSIDYEVNLGPAHVTNLDWLLKAMFREIVHGRGPDARQRASRRRSLFVLEPKFEEYSFLTPKDVAGEAFIVTIRYLLTLYDGSGARVDSFTFTGYGREKARTLASKEPLAVATQRAMRDAGAKVAVELTDQDSVRLLLRGAGQPAAGVAAGAARGAAGAVAAAAAPGASAPPKPSRRKSAAATGKPHAAPSRAAGREEPPAEDRRRLAEPAPLRSRSRPAPAGLAGARAVWRSASRSAGAVLRVVFLVPLAGEGDARGRRPPGRRRSAGCRSPARSRAATARAGPRPCRSRRRVMSSGIAVLRHQEAEDGLADDVLPRERVEPAARRQRRPVEHHAGGVQRVARERIRRRCASKIAAASA